MIYIRNARELFFCQKFCKKLKITIKFILKQAYLDFCHKYWNTNHTHKGTVVLAAP